jgi:hypothetical protein
VIDIALSTDLRQAYHKPNLVHKPFTQLKSYQYSGGNQ